MEIGERMEVVPVGCECHRRGHATNTGPSRNSVFSAAFLSSSHHEKSDEGGGGESASCGFYLSVFSTYCSCVLRDRKRITTYDVAWQILTLVSYAKK